MERFAIYRLLRSFYIDMASRPDHRVLDAVDEIWGQQFNYPEYDSETLIPALCFLLLGISAYHEYTKKDMVKGYRLIKEMKRVDVAI